MFEGYREIFVDWCKTGHVWILLSPVPLRYNIRDEWYKDVLKEREGIVKEKGI